MTSVGSAAQEAPIDLQTALQSEVHNIARSEEWPQLQLPSVDAGRQAWTILLAGIVFEAVFWGFPISFGVFQEHYSSIPTLRPNASTIALIGTIAQALFYLGTPLSALASRAFPKYQRYQICIGWIIAILGLVFASFCSSATGLIFTQGLLYAVGFVTATLPIVSMINEWCVARKGMAFGLISASSGLSGAFFPFILDILLCKYGYKITLRACSVAMAVLTFPLLFAFKGRVPISRRTSLARANWTFMKRALFWIYAMSVLLQGLGFFFPSVFLPTYAASLGNPSTKGALLLSLMSIAQIFGQFVFGYLSDKGTNVSALAVTCCIATSISTLALWGLAKYMATLIPFTLVYGFFGFGFGTMRVAMGRAVSDDGSSLFATYAVFIFLQGIGNILVGPFSNVLIRGEVEEERFGLWRYGGLIVLTGVSSACAAVVISSWSLWKLVPSAFW